MPTKKKSNIEAKTGPVMKNTAIQTIRLTIVLTFKGPIFLLHNPFFRRKAIPNKVIVIISIESIILFYLLLKDLYYYLLSISLIRHYYLSVFINTPL
jgi:Flp pilus assembly protein protease CpaA